MVKVKLNVILLIIAAGIIVFNVYINSSNNNVIVIHVNNTSTTTTTTYYAPTNIIHDCSADSNCAWVSVDCCSETAGAQWQCANKQTYIDCLSKQVLCPQVISSKPTQACSCINRRCSG